MQGRGRQRSKFRYSPLDKGKIKHDGGFGDYYDVGLAEPSPKMVEQFSLAGPSKPKLKSVEPVFTFNITSPLKSFIQSQPSKSSTPSKDKPNFISSSQPPTLSTSPISLCPQAP
jgi:hypothetical protein